MERVGSMLDFDLFGEDNTVRITPTDAPQGKGSP
jgi:hypothetical protein